MRRRKLFTLAAGVSAVLCAGVCILWVRSGSHHDILTARLSDYRAVWVESVRGGIQFGMMTNTPPELFSTGWLSHGQPVSPFPRHTHAGFGAVAHEFDVIGWHGTTRPATAYTAVVPPLALLLTTGVLPVWWSLTWRRRSKPGMCPHCGYDLRATPDRCPECGTAAGGKRAAVGPGPAEPVAPRPPAR